MDTITTSPATNLTEAISNEIVNTSVDLGTEYAELALDDFLADGILKETPIVKTIYSVGKLGMGIKERYFVKKLMVFLKAYRSGKFDQQKLNDFKFKFDTDQKYRNKVTEHLIIYIDAFLSVDKAKIFANLFRAHIYGEVSWEHFTHLSICLNAINPKAFQFLEKLSAYDFKIPEEPKERKLVRDGESESLLYACGVAYETSSWSSGFQVSQLGRDLYLFGIK